MPRLPRQLEALARMLTYILCHRPDEFGLVLSDDGFVSIRRLLQSLAAEPGWGHVRRHHLEQLAGLSQPPAFEIVGDRIRGLQPGPARLRRPLTGPPPSLLYVAIPPKAHAAVAEQGLRPPPGQELVLAADPETALKFGRRRSPDPVLVTVQARVAAAAGIVFEGYGDGLFLSAAPLGREFVQVPPLPKEQGKARPKARPAEAEPPLPPFGALAADLAQALKKPAKAGRRKDEPDWKAAARRERRRRRP